LRAIAVRVPGLRVDANRCERRLDRRTIGPAPRRDRRGEHLVDAPAREDVREQLDKCAGHVTFGVEPPVPTRRLDPAHRIGLRAVQPASNPSRR